MKTKNRFRNEYFFRILALAAFLFVAMTLATAMAQEDPDQPVEEQAAGTTAVKTDPDFDTIDDPLEGEFELFTVDDLLVARTKAQINQNQSQIINYIVETADNAIKRLILWPINTPPCFVSNDRRQPQKTRIGRFFDLSYDVYITLGPRGQANGVDCTAPAGVDNMVLTIKNVKNLNATTRSTFTMSAVQTAMVVDDFNQDGYEDLFIMSEEEVLVSTANDVTNRPGGMRFGTPTALPSADYAPRYDPASGDFNADGLKDVAWIGLDYTVHFATVCPGSMPGTICDGQEELAILLDPLQSQDVPINLTPADAENGCQQQAHALTAGDFSGEPADGLLVFDCLINANANPITRSSWYQYGSNWNMIGGVPVDETNIANIGYPLSTFAQAGKLDWFGTYDQVVVAIGSNEYCTIPVIRTLETIGVITFDQNKMSVTATEGKAGSCSHNFGSFWPWVNGMAIGRFAAIDSSETNDANYNQQIATFLNDGALRIYEVSPPDSYEASLVSESTSLTGLNVKLKANPAAGNPQDPDNLNWLTSGDLQGRSARLGPPTIIRVSGHSQPSVILGMPPMHVDYVLPDPSAGNDWEIVNFSVIPDTYNSTYTMRVVEEDQSADTNRTSYTYATGKEGEVSFELKIPYVADVEGSVKHSTEAKNEDVSENYEFTENAFAFDASATTGFGDQVWFNVSNFNVYFYPVLGKSVCPVEIPNCSSSEKQPLYVTFSGPSSSGTGPGPGHTLEWYQPVHEPGNIFSYPWNETMLRQRFSSGLDL